MAQFKTYLSQHKKDHAFCMVVVGKQHVGKTTFVEQSLVLPFVEKNGLDDLHIYDVQKDWAAYYRKPKVHFEDFILQVKDLKNSMIVFEEATLFFKHQSKSEKYITEMLVDLFHSGNMIILNFHTFRKVPHYVADLTQYFTIFKTDDTVEVIEDKFDNPKITAAFLQVQQNTDERYHLTIKK